MAFKMKAGKEGPMYKNFPGAFKEKGDERATGKEKKQEKTILGTIPPPGYDPSKEGIEKFPEVKKTVQKTLKPGYTIKNGTMSYKGNLVPEGDYEQGYKKTSKYTRV